jgi:hypothetical protein
MADTRPIRQGRTKTVISQDASPLTLVDPHNQKNPLTTGFEKEELHRLWCLYLAWRTAGDSSYGRNDREQGGNLMRRNMISEIEAAARKLIAPHCPSAPQLSFLVALMCSTADTAERFGRADQAEHDRYFDLAFEVFWNGLLYLGQQDAAWSSAKSEEV